MVHQGSCFEFMQRQRGRTPRGGGGEVSVAPYCDRRVAVEASGEGTPGRAGCRREAATPFCNLVEHGAPLRPEHRHTERGARWGAGAALGDYCPTLVTMYSWIC